MILLVLSRASETHGGRRIPVGKDAQIHWPRLRCGVLAGEPLSLICMHLHTRCCAVRLALNCQCKLWCVVLVMRVSRAFPYMPKNVYPRNMFFSL